MKNCNGCGKCCETAGNGGLAASAEEIDWWVNHRPDIARFVAVEGRGGRIWVDPASGEYLPRCPWLQQGTDGRFVQCGIYDDRPEDCRHYPVEVAQMISHDCEMLEPSDRADHRRAQRRLDLIMSDSRPPLGGTP